MSRKKLNVRAAAVAAAFAVVAVTGGVFYAQSSGASTTDTSMVLSRPDVAIAAADETTAPTQAPSATPSATPTKAKKKHQADAEKKKKTEAKKTTAAAETTKAAAKKTRSSGSTDAKAAASAADDRIQFGQTYDGIATFYGATGEGNCSYDATTDLMVAAMNEADYEGSQACGAYVDVTGPAGNTVRVKIVDRCPECEAGHIDLSAEAFAELAEPSKGRIDISWKLVSPSLSGPVSYVYKEGSTQWWCGIQVRNHRNPIRTVELKGSNGWITLDRQMYNYFLSASGEGCGGTVRITDVQGNVLTDSGIALTPGTVQSGAKQLPAA